MSLAERSLHRQVVSTLWAGLAGSLAAIAAGFAWAAASGARPGGLIPLGRVFPSLLSGDPGALVSAGLLVLLLTPVAAVLTALVWFAGRRQRAWAGIALGVLAVIAAGILVGGR